MGDLKRGTAGAGRSSAPSRRSPASSRSGLWPLGPFAAPCPPRPDSPSSPWDSRAAGTPGSRERPEAARTPPARGAGRPPASPAATSSLLLPPPGPTRPGCQRPSPPLQRTQRGLPGSGDMNRGGSDFPGGPGVGRDRQTIQSRPAGMLTCLTLPGPGFLHLHNQVPSPSHTVI